MADDAAWNKNAIANHSESRRKSSLQGNFRLLGPAGAPEPTTRHYANPSEMAHIYLFVRSSGMYGGIVVGLHFFAKREA